MPCLLDAHFTAHHHAQYFAHHKRGGRVGRNAETARLAMRLSYHIPAHETSPKRNEMARKRYEMQQKKIAEIIQKLKKVREENEISFQRIVELVEQNGEYVSLSTVRRVFEDGSETYGYQYENTLRPIANAVLGIYEETGEATADEADAMKAIIDYKTDKINELMARIERMEESYRRRIEFLRKQIELKDDRIDKRDAMIEKLIDKIIKME